MNQGHHTQEEMFNVQPQKKEEKQHKTSWHASNDWKREGGARNDEMNFCVNMEDVQLCMSVYVFTAVFPKEWHGTRLFVRIQQVLSES